MESNGMWALQNEHSNIPMYSVVISLIKNKNDANILHGGWLLFVCLLVGH
jgi:hypothetical protein